ncbi:segregation/condensation protein A [Thalassobacillus sp. CUG 92003]|uniref:segregation/condensation protein A n=1 Tax=Thalassobacillus sp. CUG 92003 TaxID=2736641 RepID=UPI0015E7C80A|nr:segregation/condensation protein A [Thalassobacillus sp. CUG 92003]
MTESYHVKVEGFEGPLDLLLHLIQRYEIDIYDIPVARITEQYMSYIHTMQQLELDVASEYLVMAATLLVIKSQMLLPNQPEAFDDEMEAEEDPRDELVRRLVEYKRYKKAAQDLQMKELQAHRIYSKPPSPLQEYGNEQAPVEPGEASVYDMLAAMSRLMTRQSPSAAPIETKVTREEIPIQTRMNEVLHSLGSNPGGTRFENLFPERTKPHVVATFMALLELMKANEITCVQASHFDELMVYKREDAT